MRNKPFGHTSCPWLQTASVPHLRSCKQLVMSNLIRKYSAMRISDLLEQAVLGACGSLWILSFNSSSVLGNTEHHVSSTKCCLLFLVQRIPSEFLNSLLNFSQEKLTLIWGSPHGGFRHPTLSGKWRNHFQGCSGKKKTSIIRASTSLKETQN